MARVSEAFPSRYLRPEDLNGRDVKVTIDEVQLEKVGRDNQYVCYFKGKRKGLVLYGQQAGQIKRACGGEDEMDNWKDHEVTLYEGVNTNAKPVIYVREPAAVDSSRHQQRAVAATAQPRSEGPNFDSRQPSPIRQVQEERTSEPLTDDDISF